MEQEVRDQSSRVSSVGPKSLVYCLWSSFFETKHVPKEPNETNESNEPSPNQAPSTENRMALT